MVQRYYPIETASDGSEMRGHMREDEDGEFVRFEDYERLRAALNAISAFGDGGGICVQIADEALRADTAATGRSE